MPFGPFGKHLITTNFRRLGHIRTLISAERHSTVAVQRPKFPGPLGVAQYSLPRSPAGRSRRSIHGLARRRGAQGAVFMASLAGGALKAPSSFLARSSLVSPDG